MHVASKQHKILKKKFSLSFKLTSARACRRSPAVVPWSAHPDALRASLQQIMSNISTQRAKPARQCDGGFKSSNPYSYEAADTQPQPFLSNLRHTCRDTDPRRYRQCRGFRSACARSRGRCVPRHRRGHSTSRIFSRLAAAASRSGRASSCTADARAPREKASNPVESACSLSGGAFNRPIAPAPSVMAVENRKPSTFPVREYSKYWSAARWPFLWQSKMRS